MRNFATKVVHRRDGSAVYNPVTCDAIIRCKKCQDYHHCDSYLSHVVSIITLTVILFVFSFGYTP